jgi:hypothetical protein
MVSKAFNMATTVRNITDEGLLPEIVTLADSIGQLPLSGNDTGILTYVNNNSSLYIWSGSGWYMVDVDSA